MRLVPVSPVDQQGRAIGVEECALERRQINCEEVGKRDELDEADRLVAGCRDGAPIASQGAVPVAHGAEGEASIEIGCAPGQLDVVQFEVVANIVRQNSIASLDCCSASQ